MASLEKPDRVSIKQLDELTIGKIAAGEVDCNDCIDPSDFNGAQDCAGVCNGTAYIDMYNT